MEVGKETIFPDHHFYTPENFAFLLASSRGMDRVVTTEKDMLKLKNLDIHHLSIQALHFEMKIWEAEEFFKRILQLFAEKEERRG